MTGAPRALLATSALALLLALSSTGCVPEFDDDDALVSEPRVLAVRSVPAEAGPEETTELEVLIASPNGDGDATPTWALCNERKPLTELGPVAQVCVDAFGTASSSLVALPEGLVTEATLDKDVCRNFGPLTPPKKQGAAAGRPVDPDPTGGYYQPVLVAPAAANAGQDATLASIRLTCDPPPLSRQELIEYALRYRANENPSIASVRVTGASPLTLQAGEDGTENRVPASSVLTLEASLAECPRTPECGDGYCSSGEDVTTCGEDCSGDAVVLGCTGSESYVWVNPRTNRVEDRREGITIAWYATAGKLESPQTGFTEDAAETTRVENRFTLPAKPGKVRLWAVIRDDRGGVGWQKFTLEVE